MFEADIQDNIFTLKYPAVTLSIGAAVVAGLCLFTAYFMLMPLIEGTFLDMPRTFFVGIGGSALAWGLYLIYIVFDHRTRLDFNMNSKRVIEQRRRFGSIHETDHALAIDAVITKEVSNKMMKNANGVGHKVRVVYEVLLKNDDSTFKLYDGFNETQAQEIIDFFARNDVKCIKATTGLNKWVAIGTLVFMAVLFAELYSMGALE